MTAERSPLQNRRRRRRRLIAGACAIVAVVVIGELVRRNAYRQWLVSEIRAAGGKARDDRSLLWRIQYWREQRKYFPDARFPANLREVNLEGAAIDHEWLEAHDWLSGLDIEVLAVDDTISNADLVRLIESHPLRQFYSYGLVMTDEVVDALCSRSNFDSFGPVDSHLTDEQLARLPLEQLQYLSVPRTEVTPQGLQKLQQCQRLSVVGLSGEQFTEETAVLLASLGTVTQIALFGADVTDSHLERLRQFRTLKHISLTDTSTTAEGVAALRLAIPTCNDIQVYSTGQ